MLWPQVCAIFRWLVDVRRLLPCVGPLQNLMTHHIHRPINQMLSARRHLAADFGAQLVDQPETLLGLDMPERPAVAGFGALGKRAHAVDRADLGRRA